MDPRISHARNPPDERRSRSVIASSLYHVHMLTGIRYASLSKTGQAETFAAQDLSLVQGINDEEIQNAIEELKRSTAAIEKQTESLRLQQNAMAALVKSDKRASQARAYTEKGQVRKWDVEKGHINAAVRIIWCTWMDFLTAIRLRNFLRV
jgi:hypothetical protein